MRDAIAMMQSKMSPEAVRKAESLARHDILAVRLAMLREEQNVRQTEIGNFTQPSVSKIERRKDMKISTLIDYLDGLGMGVEIKAYAKTPTAKVQEEVLLRV